MSEAVSRRNRRILLGIYGIALLYLVLKQLYYAVYVGNGPDQQAHDSYIIAMCRNPSLLPDFASMPLYRIMRWEGLTEFLVQSEGAVNYLGHPPLYYLLMSFLAPVRFLEDGYVAVDYLRVCLCNILLVFAGTVLAFRLGYRRLKSRSPFVHMLFAGAVVTLPELGYVGAFSSNDNLVFFAFTVFFTGVLRYNEDKTDLKTYLLIGIGFLLGSFSKLTAALILLIMLITILVMSIIREKNLKLITNKSFLLTLPCYLLFLAYEILIYRKYGTWQPGLAQLAPEYFRTTTFYVAPENRVSMSVFQYLGRFLEGIGHSWSRLYGNKETVNEIMDNGVAGIIYWIPVFTALAAAAVQAVRRKADRYTIPTVVAFLGTLAYHFYSGWSGFLKNGYLGGIQARYYLALIVSFAFIMCETLPPLFRTEKAKTAGKILAVILMLCWLAGDAPRLAILFGFPVY